MTITHLARFGFGALITSATACGLTAGGQSPPDAPVGEPDAASGEDPEPGDARPEPVPTDAEVVPVTCPASYTITIPSSSSRYRIAASPGSFLAHHTGCSEEPAATHLIAIDDAFELAEIFTQVPPQVGPVYVGVVQLPGELGIADGWQTFTGKPLPAGLWWFDQPNDGDFWESFDEQRAAVDVTGKLHDVTGSAFLGAICECDLQPVDPAVLSTLAF